jgi:hypothetical protein
MENEAKKPKYLENILFAFLGAMSAVVISLGTFGAVDNRGPASLSSIEQTIDFDARVYIGE